MPIAAKTIVGLFWVAAIFAFSRSTPALGALICLGILAAIALLVAARLGAGNVPPIIQEASEQAFAEPGKSFGALGLTLLGAALGLSTAASDPARTPLRPSAPSTIRADAPAPPPAPTASPRIPDASASVGAVPPESAAVAEERFRSMTAADHLAAAGAALAFGCPPREASTEHLDEAGRHFGALPSRVQRGRAGRAISETMARCMATRMGPELREGMANTLATRLASTGMEIRGALATGTEKTTLRIISPQCNRSVAAAIARTYGPSLRGTHFQLLECKTPGFFGSDTFTVAL